MAYMAPMNFLILVTLNWYQDIIRSYYLLAFYGQAADRQEYCFTFFFLKFFLNLNNFSPDLHRKFMGGSCP